MILSLDAARPRVAQHFSRRAAESKSVQSRVSRHAVAATRSWQRGDSDSHRDEPRGVAAESWTCSTSVTALADPLDFGLWRVRFPPVLVRTGRRLPVQALGHGERLGETLRLRPPRHCAEEEG